MWLSSAAAGPPTAPDLLSSLASYGAVGVVAGIGLWFSYRAYLREVARSDSIQKELNESIQRRDELHGRVAEQVVPALESSTHALQEAMTIMRQLLHEQETARIRREARGAGDH